MCHLFITTTFDVAKENKGTFHVGKKNFSNFMTWFTNHFVRVKII